MRRTRASDNLLPSETLDPANVRELATIAGEIGAEVLAGRLTYPSETGGWQLGDLDLSEYLAKFRDRHLVLILAPVDGPALETYTCALCGFAYNEYGECPRCKLIAQEQTQDYVDTGEDRDLIDQVRDWLEGESHGGGASGQA